MNLKKDGYKIFIVLSLVSFVLFCIALYALFYSEGSLWNVVSSVACIFIFGFLANYLKARSEMFAESNDGHLGDDSDGDLDADSDGDSDDDRSSSRGI